MTIKNIAEISSAILKRNDITEFLETGEDSGNYSNTERDLNIIIRCINLVISELAVGYLPFIKSQTFTSSNGIIEYSSFDENVLEIVNVYDEFNNKINYDAQHSFLKTKPSKVFVEYSYLPKNYSLQDTLEISNNKVTSYLLASGVVSEYLLLSGDVDLALSFFNKYKDGLEKIFLPHNSMIKERSFL